MNLKTEIVIAGALLLAAVSMAKKAVAAVSDPASQQAAGAAVADTVFSGAMNFGSGVVVGIGEAVGIPPTNQTECEKALAEGRTWDASFACPAGTFIKSFFN